MGDPMVKMSLRSSCAGIGLVIASMTLCGTAHAQQSAQQPQQPQGVGLPMQAGQVDPTQQLPRLQVPEQKVRIIIRPRSPVGF